MEKKVEDVLEILQKIFDHADLEGRYLTEKQWDILNDTVNIKEYLRKELSKAREEGIVDYYSVDELYAIEDAFHLVLRNGGEWDDIGESAREKNWELIKLTTK